jgi:hypothetical protein
MSCVLCMSGAVEMIFKLTDNVVDFDTISWALLSCSACVSGCHELTGPRQAGVLMRLWDSLIF